MDSSSLSNLQPPAVPQSMNISKPYNSNNIQSPWVRLRKPLTTLQNIFSSTLHASHATGTSVIGLPSPLPILDALLWGPGRQNILWRAMNNAPPPVPGWAACRSVVTVSISTLRFTRLAVLLHLNFKPQIQSNHISEGYHECARLCSKPWNRQPVCFNVAIHNSKPAAGIDACAHAECRIAGQRKKTERSTDGIHLSTSGKRAWFKKSHRLAESSDIQCWTNPIRLGKTCTLKVEPAPLITNVVQW